MQILSEERSRLLLHMGERYDSDTRQMVERMLSEFTTGMIDLQNISERTRLWQRIFETSEISSKLSPDDKFALELFVSGLASGGRIEFVIDHNAHKGRGVRARIKG